LSIRARDGGEEKNVAVADFINKLREEVTNKA
jgi:hypothetical protein